MQNAECRMDNSRRLKAFFISAYGIAIRLMENGKFGITNYELRNYHVQRHLHYHVRRHLYYHVRRHLQCRRFTQSNFKFD